MDNSDVYMHDQIRSAITEKVPCVTIIKRKIITIF